MTDNSNPKPEPDPGNSPPENWSEPQTAEDEEFAARFLAEHVTERGAV